MHSRKHTIIQDSSCITTRLFRFDQTGSSTSAETSKDSNLRRIEEPKVFSNNAIQFLGLPPEQSIYSAAITKKKKQIIDYTYNLENWITVFCINPEEKDEIVKFFSNYGEISNVIPPSNNYMFLEFVDKSDVDKIIKENQTCSEPILINSGNAVICERGKFSQHKLQEDNSILPHYHTLKERIRPETTIWELIQGFFNFIKWNFY